MVHNTASKVAEARLAAIVHEQLKEKIVPSTYVKQHGMDYDLIDYRVDQLIRMFGQPDDYSPTRTDAESGRRFMGYAIWRYPTPKMEGIPPMPFLKKIFVKDHLILQDGKIDCVFSKIDIAWQDTGTLEKAQMISESIQISSRYETCTASWSSLNSTLIFHYFAWCVAMGNIAEWKARKDLKFYMKAGMMEMEKADRLGQELEMPVHATIIDYLNTMYEGYVRQSEVAEEIVTQGLEALDQATGGDFLYKDPDEIAQTIARRQGSASRSTSVGTVTVSTRPKSRVVPVTPQTRSTTSFTLTRPRTTAVTPAASQYGLDEYLEGEDSDVSSSSSSRQVRGEYVQPRRSRAVRHPKKNLYM